MLKTSLDIETCSVESFRFVDFHIITSWIFSVGVFHIVDMCVVPMNEVELRSEGFPYV